MMNKILLLGLLITPILWAQEPSEEAIILNQELQFLEESAENVTILSASPNFEQEDNRSLDQSLERQYFGNGEDNVSTRTAAPKRRSN